MEGVCEPGKVWLRFLLVRSMNATRARALLEIVGAVVFALVLDRLTVTDMEKADGMMRRGHLVLRHQITVSFV